MALGRTHPKILLLAVDVTLVIDFEHWYLWCSETSIMCGSTFLDPKMRISFLVVSLGIIKRNIYECSSPTKLCLATQAFLWNIGESHNDTITFTFFLCTELAPHEHGHHQVLPLAWLWLQWLHPFESHLEGPQMVSPGNKSRIPRQPWAGLFHKSIFASKFEGLS